MKESNLRHPCCKHEALTTELITKREEYIYKGEKRRREMVINPLEQFEIIDIRIGLGPVTNISVYMIIPIVILGVMIYGMMRGEVNR